MTRNSAASIAAIFLGCLPASVMGQTAAQGKALRLADFEQWAVQNSPALKQANAMIQRSAGQATQAGLLPNPSIGYQGEQIRGGSFQGGEEGAFIEQNFILGGKLRLRRQVFEQQGKSAEIGVTEQRYRVLSDVGQNFYSTLAAQEIVKVRKNLLSLAADTVETAHQLANVGQADAPDVLQAEVEAEQAKVDYSIAQQALLHSFRALASAATKPDLPLTELTGDLENPPAMEENDLLARIIKDSPSVARARQNVEQARMQLSSARREVVPDLTLRAGLQQNNEPLNTAGARVGVQGFVSAGVTLPIFNRNQGNIQVARTDVERATSEIDRVLLSLQQNAQPLLQSYVADRERADRYKKEIIPRAEKAYQLYLVKYRAMGAAYPQVIVSQRTLFQLRVAYIRTLESVWTSAIALQNFLQ
ncbi:MAG TPA: TolC family protein [Bryobacteraceae bacterium]|nr:TolC family protein [Bryobacteraceae bacterium]